MRAGGHDVLWERTLTFVGCELEPSGNSSVFSAWSPILLNPYIPLCAKIPAFGVSVANSLLWQAGIWTLTEADSRN